MTRVVATTSLHGLDFSLLPMRLWQESKQLRTWDPMADRASPDLGVAGWLPEEE